MGVGETFAEAFVKSQLAAGVRLPKSGKAFLSVRDEDKAKAVEIGRTLLELGFSLVATRGTAAAFEKAGLKVQVVNKVMEGRPHVVDMIRNKEITLIINTVEEDRRSVRDSWSIRNMALQMRVTFYTTVAGARAACVGMQHLEELRPYSLQDLHATIT
jgi:carbamoyl-phosphate synthase large subunit